MVGIREKSWRYFSGILGSRVESCKGNPVPQEERVDCFDYKPDGEDRSERMDEQAENQGLLVLRPGALEE